MKKNTIGNLVLIFAVFSSLTTVFRLYFFFFTGKDISGIVDSSDKGWVSFVMIIVTGIAYLVGYALKGKFD